MLPTTHLTQSHNMGTKHNTSQQQHYRSQTTQMQNGFNQMQPPARTFGVALDMSKAFDTVDNSHTHRVAATNKHSTHHHQIHRKLYQRTQILHNIQKRRIHILQHTNPKQVCPKAGCSHPYYSMYTHLTYGQIPLITYHDKQQMGKTSKGSAL